MTRKILDSAGEAISEEEARKSFLQVFGFEPDPPDALEIRAVNLERIRAQVDEFRSLRQEIERKHTTASLNFAGEIKSIDPSQHILAEMKLNNLNTAKKFAWSDWYIAWALAIRFGYVDSHPPND